MRSYVTRPEVDAIVSRRGGLCLKSAEASRQGRNVYRKRRFTRCRAPLGAKCCRYAAPLGRVLFNASMAINIARLTARLNRIILRNIVQVVDDSFAIVDQTKARDKGTQILLLYRFATKGSLSTLDGIPIRIRGLTGLASKVNRGNGFAAGCEAWLCLAGRS